VDLPHGRPHGEVLQKTRQKLLQQHRHPHPAPQSLRPYLETVPKEEYPEPVRGSLRVNNKRADRQETKIYSEDDPTKTKTDKNKMLEKLKTLNPDELGLAVEIIMREAPEAFELSGDRCTIYV